MYLIKIDENKKDLFDDHIQALVDVGKVYLNKAECRYVNDKEKAKLYKDKEEAENAIDAKYEIAVKS
jgi:hypothetical protein